MQTGFVFARRLKLGPAGSIALSAVLIVASGCAKRPDQAKQEYLQRAERLSASGSYAEASLNYRKALQIDPALGRAYYGLALAEAQSNHPVATYQALTQAVRYQPDNDAAKIQLADLCLASYLGDTEQPQPLLEQLESLADQLLAKPATRFDGLRFKGSVHLLKGNGAAGIETLRQADALRPMQENVVLALARALSADGQGDEAERVATKFITAKPSSDAMVDFLYGALRQRNKSDAAEALLVRHAELRPLRLPALIRLARHYASSGRQTQAATVLQTVMADSALSRAGSMQVANLYWQMARHDAAVEALRSAAKADGKSEASYRRQIATILHDAGRLDESRAEIDAVLRSNPSDSEALVLRSTLAVAAGDTARLDDAVAKLERLVAADAQNWELKLRLGSLYRLNGDLERARQQFSAAVQTSDAAPAASLSLAEVLLALRQPDEALKLVAQCLRFDPTHRRARLLKAGALLASGKPEASEAELQRIVKSDPSNRDAQVQLALVKLAQGQIEPAHKALLSLHHAGQCDARVLEGLRQVYVSTNRSDALQRMLEAELNANTGCAAARSLLAALQVESRNYAAALGHYETLSARYPTAAGYKLASGRVYATSGNSAKALHYFREAAANDPKSADAHLLLASMLEKTGDTAGAMSEYRNVLAIDRANVVALNNLAYLMLENRGNIDEAFDLAQRAVRLADVPEFSDTLGLLHLEKGMYDSALHIFRVIVAARPNNPEFRYHLALALMKKGNSSEAAKEIQAALQKQPNLQLTSKLRTLAGTSTP